MKKWTVLFLAPVFLFSCKSESFEEKVERIHKEAITIDSHTDTPLRFTRSDFDLNTYHNPAESGSKIDFPKMQQGGLDAVFFAAFVGQRERTPEENYNAYQLANRIIDSIYVNVNRYPEVAAIASSPDEIYDLEEAGKRIVYIGMENGFPIGKEIKNLKYFYDRGVRYITLCHTKNNDICDSSTDTTEHNGLSEFGKEVVLEMNKLGMIIDVTHISDSSFYDVLEITKAPVIASHSCARAVCDNARNLNDDMLKKLAKNDGVVQMCLYTDYVIDPIPNPKRDSAFQAIREKYNHFKDLSEEEYEQARKEWHDANKNYPKKLATVSDLVDHIDHVVDFIGIDYVGIGSDFDGGGALKDCYDASQMKNITAELLQRGYSEEDIKKIWGRNLLRVFKKADEFADK